MAAFILDLPVDTIGSRPGGKTPVAGVIPAATLLMVLLVAAPLAAAVPMTVLGGFPASRRGHGEYPSNIEAALARVVELRRAIA